MNLSDEKFREKHLFVLINRPNLSTTSKRLVLLPNSTSKDKKSEDKENALQPLRERERERTHDDLASARSLPLPSPSQL